MRLVLSTKRPCMLEGGDARRVPQRKSAALIGYHVCCPRCRFVCTALLGSDGIHIKEERPDELGEFSGVHIKEGRSDELAGEDAAYIKEEQPVELTFSVPLRCTYCQVLLHVTRGELRLEEDAHVRPVRFR